MPEWLVERGIGETRAALVEAGRILESRILLDGTIPVGSVVEARLAGVGADGRNALAVLDDGTEILLPHRPQGVSEGQRLHIEITREAIAGPEPWKRPLGRSSDTPSSIAELTGRPAMPGEFDAAGWGDVLEEAASGEISFAGGALRLFVTPAMTLFDVDGTLPTDELAVLGARAAAQAVRRLGIGGSIGVDLPNAGKTARAAAAEAIDRVLDGTRFERTAVNGFGFVQIVRPRPHASLPEIYAGDRPAAEARALLRRAESHIGGLCLAVPAAIGAVLERNRGWLDELGRRVGGRVTLRVDARLAMSGGHAEPL
ncbi:ribonuclease [Sphingomonas arenae]|uniref:ribonuclease n=1 Tax=Sphingomonas arenae TaxID=2812555 RepID=UPI00196795BC|nr:ribonuclease [Sphingomonas arenae]